uniref:Serine/threonine-protein kinase PLK n=1 Tax=Panagrolaimus sp. PS1159 TaxID=55785 RepID=A0AC35FVM7_9BILA
MAPTRTIYPVVRPIICDTKTQSNYTLGEFLGKGGFAACYKVTTTSGKAYAAKIVSKQFIKQQNTEKAAQLQQEIKIHKSLTHVNIVKLFFAFEDSANIYIVLELCNRRSMVELQCRRKVITEPEVRYFTKQVAEACVYIHSLHIIHRDLKLGNLFITDQMILKPPFETPTLKHTYRKIRTNEFDIPEEMDKDAACLIKRLVATEPMDRPEAFEIIKSPFMQGFIPKTLPVTCLVTKPVFTLPPDVRNGVSANIPETQMRCNVLAERTPTSKAFLSELDQQISEILNKKLVEKPLTDDLLKDPASIPIYWVSKWIDYSAIYAFAYQLCDGSQGASFNDGSKLIMDSNKEYCQYRSHTNEENFFAAKSCPIAYEKKLHLLQNFESFMTLNLMKAGSNILRDGVEIGRLPVLQHWIRTKNTVSFLLSNGTYQCNFICDHSKIIICPLMGAATLIDSNQTFHTYKLSTLVSSGAPKELTDRLTFSLNYIKKLQEIISH